MNGLDLQREHAERSEQDWVFGAASQRCIALIPQMDRHRYLPPGEVQRGKEDFQDCASRGPVNILEAKFTYLIRNGLIPMEKVLWLQKKGYLVGDRVLFSDRFVAIKSGTTRQGNSLKGPLQAIHAHGLIPKALFPAKRSMTWAEYHDRTTITARMEDLGREFLSHFPITYERVLSKDFTTAIEEDMLDVAGHAWPEPVNGEYARTDDPINHVFVYFAIPRFQIFDNYEEGRRDFIKKLAPDYALLDYGYRLVIGVGAGEEPRLVRLRRQLFALMEQLIETLTLGVWK